MSEEEGTKTLEQELHSSALVEPAAKKINISTQEAKDTKELDEV